MRAPAARAAHLAQRKEHCAPSHLGDEGRLPPELGGRADDAGGDQGGHVVAVGTPAQIASNSESITGRYLSPEPRALRPTDTQSIPR